MYKISFLKKLITCLLAGMVIGAAVLRQAVTYFRTWMPMQVMGLIYFFIVATALIYFIIWQFRKTNDQATLAFWQGLIRYGVAFDLAEFGWSKICHMQINRHMLYRGSCADSLLTVVYFDVRNGCVFEFNTPQKRWNGTYTKKGDSLEINWRSPTDKPAFRGLISPADSNRLMLRGTLEKDSISALLEKKEG